MIILNEDMRIKGDLNSWVLQVKREKKKLESEDAWENFYYGTLIQACTSAINKAPLDCQTAEEVRLCMELAVQEIKTLVTRPIGEQIKETLAREREIYILKRKVKKLESETT